MAEQEFIDRYYFSHGRCCAGCDWWRHVNSLVGECTKSAPAIPGEDRAAMLDMHNFSIVIPAGHAMTRRDHVCGDFRDSFDWSSLPLPYRKRVGAPHRLAT